MLIFSEDFTSYQIQYPLKFAPFNHWAYGYVHFNSFIAVGDCIYLVLHNGGVKTGRPSCLVVFDLEWRIIRRLLLPGLACHNIAFFDKNQPIICGSLHGELINFHGRIAKIDPAMTRGVSLNKHELVVGASQFAIYKNRQYTPGRAHFLNRDFQSMVTLELPAAPTDIRRIDGEDHSLSNVATRLFS